MQELTATLVLLTLNLLLTAHADDAALREELATLKVEVEKLRSGNQIKNDHLTVQWLSGSVAELRGELAELSSSVNRTEELAAREALGAEVRLLRGDVSSLRRQMDVLKAEQEARVAELSEELREVKARCLHELVVEDKREELGEDKRYRHQRLLKKKVETLVSSQIRLEAQVRRLEKSMQTPTFYQRVTSNDILEEDLAVRVAALEDSNKKTANISRQVASLSKLHVSMLELLESVESLETKVDNTEPEFRREISRLEFSMAQTTSSVSILREEQENQRTTVKAMAGAMSAMQDKLEQTKQRVTGLEANATKKEESLTQPQHSTRLPGLIARLTRVISDYEHILSDLPHECSWVDGTAGLYIVAPDGGRPLVTFCDQTTGAGGWTLVQRRQDGSQEFNRKWDDYANGFGSPLGEFWIGNEALHRLTAANLSSLRIDLVDIYGKAWYAEYDQFSVGNASDGYRLTVSGYHGNASDALDYQNHMQFSTVDSDRDVSNTHCAANYEGGWWFSHCQHANLNGRYNLGLTWFDASRNEWIAVARSEMKVRSRQRHRTLT